MAPPHVRSRHPSARLHPYCVANRYAPGPCVTGARVASGSGTRVLTDVAFQPTRSHPLLPMVGTHGGGQFGGSLRRCKKGRRSSSPHQQASTLAPGPGCYHRSRYPIRHKGLLPNSRGHRTPPCRRCAPRQQPASGTGAPRPPASVRAACPRYRSPADPPSPTPNNRRHRRPSGHIHGPFHG